MPSISDFIENSRRISYYDCIIRYIFRNYGTGPGPHAEDELVYIKFAKFFFARHLSFLSSGSCAELRHIKFELHRQNFSIN